MAPKIVSPGPSMSWMAGGVFPIGGVGRSSGVHGLLETYGGRPLPHTPVHQYAYIINPGNHLLASSQDTGAFWDIISVFEGLILFTFILKPSTKTVVLSLCVMTPK